MTESEAPDPVVTPIVMASAFLEACRIGRSGTREERVWLERNSPTGLDEFVSVILDKNVDDVADLLEALTRLEPSEDDWVDIACGPLEDLGLDADFMQRLRAHERWGSIKAIVEAGLRYGTYLG